MKPIDQRLFRYARATRVFLIAVVLLGAVGAGLVIAQAMLIAEVVVGAFQHGFDAGRLATPLILLAVVAAGRGLVAWVTELAAHRASAAVKSELRGRLLERAARLGPGWLAGQRTGSLVALATRGVDALDDYFSRYLPQLGLAVVVPVAVLVRVVTEDWVSAAIIVGTLPLIPIFMMLIGWATQSRMDRQWRLLSRLSGHFLDVVAGLPTLKVFGRAKAQADSIRKITGEYRAATMRTLRIAFLSSFALELLATLSVALVAVTIGMRLVHGEMDLYVGLVILVLAPEAYLPLRQVGAQFHAAAEGLAAAEEIFAVLETPLPESGTQDVPAGRGIGFDRVSVRYEGRDADAVSDLSFEVAEGETVALVGPSGAGKSTLLAALLGFVRPSGGRVLVGGADLADVSREAWHARVAWVPQRPQLYAGSIADNVRLARPDADDAAVLGALRDAGALEFVEALPEGVATVLGEDGAGLSAGQRQRLALARAFLADRPVVLLDEPTAALDGETEAGIVEAVRRLAVGRTVLLVVHRPALLAVADRVVRIEAPGEGRTGSAPTVPAPAAVPAQLARQASEQARETRDEGAARGHVLTRLRAAARPRRSRLLLALLLGALALGSSVGLMATSGWLISRASEQPPVLYLMVAVTATRAFGIGRACFRYAERLVSHDAVLRMLADTRVAVYRRLERLAPAGLRTQRRGDLLSRLVADVDALQDYWLRWLLPASVAALVGVGSVAFTAWMLPAAGAVLAVGLLLAGIGVPLLSGAVSRRAERKLAPARGVLATRAAELLTGTAELTVAGALPRRTAEARAADSALTRIASRTATATALGDGLTALITGLTVAAAALVGVQGVRAGQLDGVALAVVVLTPLAAFESVLGLPLAVQYRQRVHKSAERVYEVLDAPEPVREPERPAPAPQDPFPLVVRDLGARYEGAARPALAGVGLTLERGRRVAVVGPSGSGKTTLAQVLLRFLDAESGTYTLGGTDADALDGDAVRRLVGLCAQDAHLFDSSVRENLLLAKKDAGEDELRAALDRVRLLEWADALPDGLDTLVGEHAARLSGGQRQRLALARALLADFPVLVLDEPAEHLDLETADALTADLLDATRGRATVLITHRLAGLDAVDEVIVLDGGRVAQRGSYAELAAVDGPLRRMREREGETELLVGAGPAVAAAGFTG
ncbi:MULTISPECIES: thiol reductant ABC exporter subunit CydD [unclassified Streptomyces]|uniref:thiol reductant ABC exporter subunit CydD n=1 Tax=unclassified Streptomyces TaxID=2593676 RepID=UPI000DBA0B33|nr:thiol reductant ABC exporter subunit CydD [Streptomyces sp. PsTaAH-137]MYT70231.1 thiol reductant ABC exporter subunit CydD [Streptomyces sp. SID8367]RAJ88805.1 ATP-binding cassette subfamily C protein CydCD [Streptomyces sp. PsTaAH-137]